MRTWNKLLLRLRSVFRRGRVEAELSAELAFHFDHLVAENLAAGMAPGEARHAARRAFGGVTQIAEECREMRRTRPWDELVQDLAYTARTLRRSPAFTLIAVFTLALGIGANTAIWSVLHALLLRPLPVRAPEELVALGNPTRIASLSTGSVRTDLISYPLAREILERSRSFSGAFASGRTGQLILGTPGTAGARESVRGRLVSGSYFAVLGVGAARGRTFSADDDRAPGAAPFAVLSYDYWQRRFAGDAAVVGRRLVLNGFPVTVIGVARPGFSGEIADAPTDLWLPLSLQPQINPGHASLDRWDVSWLLVLGRLQPGVSLAAARGEVNDLFSQIVTGRLGTTLPETLRPDAKGLQDLKIEVTPGSGGFSRQRRELAQPLFAILAMVMLVLLIACANIANLLLERAVARQKEIAVRLALGAGRARLIRQLLTESLVLAALGGGLGALAAWSILGGRSTQLGLRPSLPVLAATAAVVVATGLLFGLAPALGATRVDLAPTLKENARSLAGSGGKAGRWPLGKLLVVSQLTLSFLLLTGAGLFVGTLRNLEHLELGFPRDEIVMVHVDPVAAGYTGERMASFSRQLLERLQALPGVTGATFSENGLFSGTESGTSMHVEGVGSMADEGLDLSYDRVGPRYFEAIGIPALLGRGIGTADGPSAPKVAVINQAFRKRYFADRDPLGRHLIETGSSGKSFEIVGVVADVHDHEIRGTVPPRFYVPLEQTDDIGDVAPNFEIRTAHPTALLAPVARALQAFDPHLAFEDPHPLAAMVDASIRNERTVAQLASAFGGIALLLAAIGLYGVLSYTVARRTHEIGIRMALGSARAGVLGKVVAETLVLAGVGVALGVPLALGLARLVASRLFGLAPTDPATLAAAILTLVLVAILAGALPGSRATRVEPVQALRYE